MDEPDPALPQPYLPADTAASTNLDLEPGHTDEGHQVEAWSTPATRSRRLARGSLLGSGWLFAALVFLMHHQKLEPDTTEQQKAIYNDAYLAFYILWIFVIFVTVVCFHDYLHSQAASILLTFCACIAFSVVVLKSGPKDIIPVLPLISDFSLLGPVTPRLVRIVLPALLSHIAAIPSLGGNAEPPLGANTEQP